jgi:hypothetical protein
MQRKLDATDQLFCGASAMAVGGLYIAWRIRHMLLPFVRVYGQWVEERIIPMSEQLQSMADKVEQKAYEDLMSEPVGDDYMGDGSEEAQEANDIGLSFYENISSMYQGTLNLFSAGLFHVVEQQLADLTRDGAIRKPVSNTSMKTVVEWYLKNCQLDLTQFSSWSVIEELRLVANTTKHAEGPPAKQLREKHPELFLYPSLRKKYADKTIYASPLSLPLGGDGLYVTSDDFRTYHKAVLECFEWLRQYFEDHGEEHYPI